MEACHHNTLPLFERFNEVAADDELFARVANGETLGDLPDDDIFLVAHRTLRDAPYSTRDFFGLTYVLEGHVVKTIAGQEVHLLEDSLCLVTPSTVHGLRAVDPDAVVVVLCLRPALFASGVFADFLAQDLDISRVMRGVDPHGFMVFSDTYGRVLYRSIRTLLEEYDHAGHTANFAVRARVLLLLAQLSDIDTYSFYGLDQRMMDILACLREHCATASVSSLAARFGYSETYFSHLVRERCGVRARELIVAARLRQACQLLLTTELSVNVIATSVGYESYSHFNRIFRQTYHITPAAYRAFATRELASWGQKASV